MDWLEEAINYLAAPKRLREETITAFCERWEIERSTFYYEMRKPENQQAILSKALTEAKDSAPDVLDKLTEKAMAGNDKSIDQYLEFILQLAKQLDIKSDGKQIVFMPPEIAAKNGIEMEDTPNG
jgi:hypothetical protein